MDISSHSRGSSRKTFAKGILTACLAAFCIGSQNNSSASPNTIIASPGNPGAALVNDNVSGAFGDSFTLAGSDIGVEPLTLSAGTTYVPGVSDSTDSTDEIIFQETLTLDDDVDSLGAPLFLDGIDLGFPTTPNGGNAAGSYGPNATLSAVPEPSTLALAGLGGLGYLLHFRRRK